MKKSFHNISSKSVCIFVLVLSVFLQSTAAQKTCTFNSRGCSKGQVCKKTRWFVKRCTSQLKAGATCTYRYQECSGSDLKCEWDKSCARGRSSSRVLWYRRRRRCQKICYQYSELGGICGKAYQVCTKGTCKRGKCVELRNLGQTCSKPHQACKRGSCFKYGRGPMRCYLIVRPGRDCRGRYKVCGGKGGKCLRVRYRKRSFKRCFILRGIGQSCHKWFIKCKKGSICRKGRKGKRKCVRRRKPSPSPSPSASPSPIPVEPVIITTTIGFATNGANVNVQTIGFGTNSAAGTVRQISGDGVTLYDFSGVSFIGQEAIVEVTELQGDFNAENKFLTLNINNDGTNGVQLTGLSNDLQCPPTLVALTRPTPLPPSISTTIIQLENGTIGVALTITASSSVAACPSTAQNPSNRVTIAVRTVVPPVDPSPVARPLVF